MKLSGSEIVMEVLSEQGIDTVFGYPGKHVLNIYDALYKYKDKIKHVLTAHQQGASHAADGYSRASGKVGVCIASGGAGACNLVTGLATANMDSIPMVAITGDVPTDEIGSFQAVDTIVLTIPVTKHSFQVTDVNDLADTLREAFRVAASGRPGPVLVDIPEDVQQAEAEYTPKAKAEKIPYAHPDKALLNKAIEMINDSRFPLIYCGGGVINGDCAEYIEPLADKADTYVSFSMMGLTAMDSSSFRYLGMNDMHGRYASTKAVDEADLIIAAGVRFTDRATGNKSKFAKKAKIIHLDIDSAEFSKNIYADIKICGNLGESLKYILEHINKKNNPMWHDIIREAKKAELSAPSKDGVMTAIDVIRAVNNAAEPDTLIATDVGQHQMWVAQEYRFKKPRTHLSSGGLGTMGYGLGAAIGGSMATGKKAVLFTSDGSFGMNLIELATAVSQDLPITIVILNNSRLGMIRQWQSRFYGNRYMATIPDRRTDFVKLAEAFGANGYRAENIEDFSKVFAEAFSLGSPSVIECIVPPDEDVLPMVPPNGSLENIIIK